MPAVAIAAVFVHTFLSTVVVFNARAVLNVVVMILFAFIASLSGDAMVNERSYANH